MKRGVLALALTLPVSAMADGHQSVAGLLGFIQQECPVALDDPAAFIAKFPATQTNGTPTVGTSPDQTLVYMSGTLNGQKVSADWSDHGSHTMRHCTAGLEAVAGGDIETALRSWFAQNHTAPLRGGDTPPTDHGGQGGQYTYKYARYVAMDLVQSKLGPVFTTMQVFESSLSVSVTVVHPTIGASN